MSLLMETVTLLQVPLASVSERIRLLNSKAPRRRNFKEVVDFLCKSDIAVYNASSPPSSDYERYAYRG